MATMLSPGVYTHEIDMSIIVPSVSTATGAFAGIFKRGQVGVYKLVSSVDDLITNYGEPTDSNYNDWFQCYSFLLYGSSLLVSRAIDANGTLVSTTSSVTDAASVGAKTVSIDNLSNFTEGDKIAFNGDRNHIYTIDKINASSVDLVETLSAAVDKSAPVEKFVKAINAAVEAKKVGGVAPSTLALKKLGLFVPNSQYFEDFNASFGVTDATNVALQFIAKDPGEFGNGITITIGNTADFTNGSTSQALPGVLFSQLFDRYPTSTEIAVVIASDGVMVEKFIVSLVPGTKDYTNRSTYIEDVLNRQSNYVYVVHNKSVTAVASALANDSTALRLAYGNSGLPNSGDIEDAYDVFSNKEEVDVDIIIANEQAHLAASTLAMNRADCICYVGALYENVIGLKSSDIVAKQIAYVNDPSSPMNLNTSFVAFYDNYAQFYDKWNDKLRWCNIAGLIAGARAKTSYDLSESEASAGLINGVLKGITKLYYSPHQGARDLLYKSRVNPVVSFVGQGKVIWGQKTLLGYDSSFSRVNVRCLFNKLERAISKMAKAFCFSRNNEFTRERFKSTITPVLAQDPGVDQFYVDLSKNTPEVIARGEFIVNILIKPVYTMEFISLGFVAVGASVKFSDAILAL
jgi:hypothetical protein